MPTSIVDWVATLNDDSIANRIEAAQHLASLGEDAAPAALSLLVASDDSNESLREWCIAGLESCGAPGSRDLLQLVDYIQPNSGASNHIVYWAITLMGRMETAAASATTPVVQFAECMADEIEANNGNDSKPETPSAETLFLRAIWALGKIAPRNSEVKKSLDALAQRFPRFEAKIGRAIERFDS